MRCRRISAAAAHHLTIMFCQEIDIYALLHYNLVFCWPASVSDVGLEDEKKYDDKLCRCTEHRTRVGWFMKE